MSLLHHDAKRILQRLQAEGISSLLHFTCIEHLPSIRDMGAVCSKQTLEEADRWPPSSPGGNQLSHDLDRINDNWDKVSLYFTPRTPMSYRKKRELHLCFFILKIDVAARAGVVFTDRNAASTGQMRGEGFDGLNLVNFDAVRSRPRPTEKEGWHRPVQAEILVPKCIELENVLEVAFVSKSSMEEAERLWGSGSHPPFMVNPEMFADWPGADPAFPFVRNVILTDQPVDKSNYLAPHRSSTSFRRTQDGKITLISLLQATPGISAQVNWIPGDHITRGEFQSASDWWHWPSIAMAKLPDGLCSVEYRLNDIRWATINFSLAS